ncbi:MAG: pitrilysin family protein, partial [Bacteroidota bacterium]
IYEKELGNGMAVLGIQNTELPLVEFSIRIKGGMLFDQVEKVGVANLITDIMMEGTANKTPEQLEDAIGQLGADINMYTSSEYITITGSTLARNYEKVLDIVEELLLEPRWDEAEFERLKSKTLTTIQQRSVQPNTVATNAFNKLIYGEENILSNSSIGTGKSVEPITLDDLKAYYDANFSPNLASFHIVGSVSEQQVLNSLKDLEANWANKNVELPELPTPVASEDNKVYFIDIPDAKQSVVRIGMPSVKGSDEDYYAATVVNQRLGSGTSARLFQQLREEKGYTYGAYSFIPRRINDSYFAATSSVRTNVTLESVELFDEILRGYANDYSEEDLEKTKSTLIRGNALAFETLFDKMGILQNISTYDLPQDYIKKEEEVVQNLTLEDAKALISKYINSDQMIYLVVGDAKTQFDRLKAAGLGEPVLIDKDAQPIDTDIPN